MSSVQQFRPTTVVVVDDNPGDVGIIKHAFHEFAPDCHVTVVENKHHLLALVQGRPHIAAFFIDLNLGKDSGADLLKEIRRIRDYEHVPVVVLSGSTDPRLVDVAYGYPLCSFVQKPAYLDEYIRALSVSYTFWCSVAVLPKGHET